MQGKRKLSWFRLLLVILIAYFGYVGFNQQMHLNNIDREKELAALRVEQGQKMNKELIEEKNKLKQAGYVEKIAREELGLVKPGEMPYISSGDI